MLLGEFTPRANLNYDEIVRNTIKEIATTLPIKVSITTPCAVLVALAKQSGDIAMGVDKALEAKSGQMTDAEVEALGAADQGMMFGFACNETPALMPMPIYLAQSSPAACRSAQRRHAGLAAPGWKKPGNRMEYRFGKPVRVDTVVISTQHAPEVSQEEIRKPSSNTSQTVIPARCWTTRPSSTSISDRRFRHRRPDGRFRRYRTQDHRGHLLRHGPPRRRRLSPVKTRPRSTVRQLTPRGGRPRTW
jgi:S-adenosylmethionine synthetase